MKYPEVLLPRQNFKLIDSEIPDYIICRITSTKDIIKSKTGKLKDEVLSTSDHDFFDYSTNLLGHFLLDHNYLTLTGLNKKYFYTYWNFNEAVTTPKFNDDFFIENSKGYFFIQIGSIHNSIKCPYSKPKNIEGEVTAIILHTPTNSNYWHFSIKWRDKDGSYISPNLTQWKYQIINTMRAALIEQSLLELPITTKLPQELFCK